MRLELGANYIADKGATALGKMLAQNDTLAVLDLGRCEITAMGVAALVKPISRRGSSSALQARLTQQQQRGRLSQPHPPPLHSPPRSPGPEPSLSAVPPRASRIGGAASSPTGAGSRAAALAAHITAAGLALDTSAHPSPSELPHPPSHLRHPDAVPYSAVAMTQHALELSQEEGEEGGDGDVVLDQLVSGLLATPCIRRRLDRLYGKGPGRSYSAGSRLDLLSQPGSRAGSVAPSVTGSAAGSGPASPGMWHTPRDYLGVGLPPPPQSPAGGAGHY